MRRRLSSNSWWPGEGPVSGQGLQSCGPAQLTRVLSNRLNLRGPVSLKTAVQTPALGMLFPLPGGLYAEVCIPSSMTPDTDQGFLLSRAVSTALVAPVPAPDNTVFEVRLETRASSEEKFWLQLPAHCCSALGLQSETSPVLEVQFQINPLTFRFWHQAVDALPEERLVVPDLQACALPRPQPTLPTLHGNPKQKLAVAFIMGSSPGGAQPVAPLLIYGPFGTGKTYTLAMASLEVIRQPHTKVLICTHTNRLAHPCFLGRAHPWAGVTPGEEGHPALGWAGPQVRWRPRWLAPEWRSGDWLGSPPLALAR